MQLALATVALDLTGEIDVVRSALSVLGLGDDVLAAAEIAGPLQLDGCRVHFIDPSRRSASARALDPRQRRQVHRALGRVLTGSRHRLQGAEHIASAAVGADDEASAAFRQLAEEATELGECARAAGLFTRAATWAADPEQRARCLYLAGDGYWNAADYARARESFDTALLGTTDPHLRADIVLQVGQLEMYQQGPRHARDLFVTEAAAVESHDPDRAANLLVHAASTAMLSGDIVGSLVQITRAAEVAQRGDGSSALAASLMAAYLSLLHGDVDEFNARFPALERLADELKDCELPEVDLFLEVVGMLHVYNERWEAGRVYLSAVAHRAGRRSRTATVALAMATLAELCWRSGRWREAWELATSPIVKGVTLTGARVWLLAYTAHLDAGFGRADDCRARAEASLAESEPMGLGTAVMWACSAIGLLELGLGNPAAAAAHLDRVQDLAAAHELSEPSYLWWQADHVEALARSGRGREAARALDRFDANAKASPAMWPSAMVARCRGLLAADDGERWFAEALNLQSRLAAPFELARTLLCRADHRARTGAHRGAFDDVSEAVAIFDSLGATAWSAQGRALVARLADHDESEATSLTACERRVAAAVARGLSNKATAASLFISEKTVEFHLRNIYRKLGITSRTQLVRRLSQSEPGADPSWVGDSEAAHRARFG